MRNKKLIILISFSFILLLIFIYVYMMRKSIQYPSEREISQNPQVKKIITTPSPTITPSPMPTPTPYLFQGLKTEKFYITFYGWPDNDPPGNGIAYPASINPNSIHYSAGGTGTYSDPVTFATDPGLIDVGTVYYVPFLQKYIIMEDLCATCIDSWNNSKKHIDIWMESNEDNERDILRCQRKFTKSDAYVVTSPKEGLPINVNPLFDTENGECND